MLAAERGSQTAAKEGFSDRRELILDLVHLTRQCQGDAELEDSLLRLFRRQAQTLSAHLSSPHSTSVEAKVDLARKLRDSAVAVGAKRVAQAAALVAEDGAQRACAGKPSPALVHAIAELESTIEETILEIDRLRR